MARRQIFMWFTSSRFACAGRVAGDVLLTLDNKVMGNGRQFTVDVYRQPIGERVDVEALA